MHVEQRILHQRNTPQGKFTILPTKVTNLPTETGSRGVASPPHTPLEPNLLEGSSHAHALSLHTSHVFVVQNSCVYYRI